MSIKAKSVKRLQEAFLDEKVVIYLRGMNVVTVNEEGQSMEISAMTEGYIIDIDEDYYYLGNPDGEVTRTIGHDIAQMVELAFTEEDMIMQIELPENDEDMH